MASTTKNGLEPQMDTDTTATATFSLQRTLVLANPYYPWLLQAKDSRYFTIPFTAIVAANINKLNELLAASQS
jgi:hypothetical protein